MAVEGGMGPSVPTGRGRDTQAAGANDPELDPCFDIIEPASLRCGVVMSSPHSGSIYPPRFLQSVRLDAASLRRSEDAFVDEVFADAVDVGAPLLRARFPRAYLDANREPYELDPRMFEGRLPPFANTRSIRVAGGLGTIARVVGDAQEIYARRIPVEEALRRIEGLYKPYHAALRGLVDRAVARFGIAILLDCHSMPSSVLPGPASAGSGGHDEHAKPDFVIGDRYGTSCDRIFVDAVEYELIRFGYSVQRNKPYAGGFITEHYGQPGRGHHALQIEINRALYMDERTMTRTDGFERLRGQVISVVRALRDVEQARLVGERTAAE